ncbi:MAG: M56 family metallopeptidase, partial [Oscillospiraceae bacterium]|nr:M56 family metallopeptidase [Oscillospiraceae bacterium]
MLQIMISSSVLILTLLGLRLVLRDRISMRLRYALWLLVAVRLLIPVTVGHSALSVENFTSSTPVAEGTHMQSKPGTELSPDFGQATVPDFQSPQVGENGAPVQGESILSQETAKPTMRPDSGQPSLDGMSPAGDALSVAREPSLSWKQVFTVIWILGTVLLSGAVLANNLRFQHRLKKRSVAISEEGCPIPVYETEEVVSPCLVGFLRPRIYLRPGLSSEMKTHVLAHEYTHYRHGDHVWTMIRTLCLCAYWFHPLVWVAAYISRQDGELACDEGAIYRLGEQQRIPYGRTLLQVIVHANYRTNFLNTATTMGADKAQLKERMTMIAKKPKKLILALIVALLVVSLAVGCSFTGGKEEPAPEGTDSREEMQETAPTEDTAEDDESKASEDAENVMSEIEDKEKEYEKLKPIDPVTDGIHVVDVIVEENYRVPQFAPKTEEYSYITYVNKEILELFEDRTQFKSVEYSVTRTTDTNTFKEKEQVLSLLITAITTDNETLYAAYNLNAETGYDFFRKPGSKLKSERFAYELLQRYETTGSLSYTDSTHQILLQNLGSTAEQEDLYHRTVNWYTEDGTVMCSFLYYPLDGSAPYRYTCPEGESYSGITSIDTPHVEELYYESYKESESDFVIENHIPFLLMNGPRAVEINGEILRTYSRNAWGTTYSWSVHGEILSLAIEAGELDYYGTINKAYVLNWPSMRDANRAQVLAQVNMTEEEYNKIAGPCIADQFFHVFSESTLPVPDWIIEKNGSAENVAESVPFL